MHDSSSAAQPAAAIPSPCEPATARNGWPWRLVAAVWLVACAAFVALLLAGPAHAAPACDWNDPGRAPYRGDLAAAVDRYASGPGAIPQPALGVLRSMVRHGWGGESVLIDRDSIDGGRYTDLRDMHWRDGLCRGAVDRSGWTAGRMERAMVYTVDGHSVIVPESCNNVARVTDRLALAEAPTWRQLEQARRDGVGAGGAAVAGGAGGASTSAGQGAAAGGIGGPGMRALQFPAQAGPVLVPEPGGAWVLGLVAVALVQWLRKRGR